MPKNDYPLHPGQTHIPPYYCTIPLDEYEGLKKKIRSLENELATTNAMLEERNKQVGELKDRIAPKQSDKTLQERLNEVCKKHGVSTLQDLDWAFCESEKRHTRDNIEAAKEIEQLQAMLEKRNADVARLTEERDGLIPERDNIDARR